MSRPLHLTPALSSYGIDYAATSHSFAPIEQQAIVDHRAINFVRLGPTSPTTLLFLPGLGATWGVWTSVLPLLRDTYDCIALDLPGFGGSEVPARGMAVENVSTVIADFVKSQIGKSVFVVAHSLGGLVAADLARRFPSIVRGVALVNGVFPSFLEIFHRPSRILRNSGQYGTALLAFVGSALPLRDPLRKALLTSHLVRRVVLGPFVQRPALIAPNVAANLAVGGSIRSVVGVLRNGFGHEYFQALESLESPLFIHGAEDRLSSGNDLKVAMKLSPQAEVVILAGTKHVSMVEYPKEISELLAGWCGRA